MRRHRKHERGFALIETIVAFMVLAVGLASIGAAMAAAIRSDAKLEARRVATQLARSRLEAVGISAALVPGRKTGRGAGDRRWSETVTAVPKAAVTPGAPPPPESTLRAYWVEVHVETGDGGEARLAGLKLSAAGGP